MDGIIDSMDMSLSKLREMVRQGSQACYSSWGHRVGHDLVTEQQQQSIEGRPSNKEQPECPECWRERKYLVSPRTQVLIMRAKPGTSRVREESRGRAGKVIVRYWITGKVSSLFNISFRDINTSVDEVLSDLKY